MLNNLPLLLPPLKDLPTGDWATWQYYKFPWSYFYQKKLYMIRDLMTKDEYESILDYGTGSGVFLKELGQYTNDVKGFFDYVKIERKFELVVCGSVLEFVDLGYTLPILEILLPHGGELIVASPMTSWKTKLYFKTIGNKQKRNHHETIIKAIGKKFYIEEITYWEDLYFALRARKR